MTDDRTADAPAWTDERLAEAFRARAAARPTPADLADALLDRVRRSPARSTSRPVPRLFGPLAAAAAIAVVVGAVAFVRPAVAPGGSPLHSDHLTPSSGPATAFGLSILTIADALVVRDTDTSDREIAVRGYFSPPPGGIRCVPPPSPVANPVRLQCPFQFQWILDSADRMPDVPSTLPPGRVGFQPLLPFLDTSVLDAAADRTGPGGPLVEVVLIGHFHDRRGEPALCDMPDPAVCAGFIADAIYSIAGARVVTSEIVDMEPFRGEPRPTPTWTPVDVKRLLLAADANLEILALVALPGNRIGQLEPALGTGALGIIDRPVAWAVIALDPGAAGAAPTRRTFLLVDGTAEAYESVPFAVENVGFLPFPLVALPPASDAPMSSQAFPTGPQSRT